MRKFLSSILKKIVSKLENVEPPVVFINALFKKVLKTFGFIDLMEFPLVSLTKKRTNPITYESAGKMQKVVISGHEGHFLANIYDWDIILAIARRIHVILKNGSTPPLTITIPRDDLLNELYKNDIKKGMEELMESLSRLKCTGIDYTNKNTYYRNMTGFIYRWEYTEWKDEREIAQIKITLSQWLYDSICECNSQKQRK